MGFSRYAQNRILTATFHGSTYQINSAYVALFTTVPSDSTSGTEVSGNGYARVGAPISSYWSPASGGAVVNSLTVTFPQATAAWGNLYGWGIFNGSGAADRVFQGSLQAPVTISSGDTFSFTAGDITFTIVASC